MSFERMAFFMALFIVVASASALTTIKTIERAREIETQRFLKNG